MVEIASGGGGFICPECTGCPASAFGEGPAGEPEIMAGVKEEPCPTNDSSRTGAVGASSLGEACAAKSGPRTAMGVPPSLGSLGAFLGAGLNGGRTSPRAIASAFLASISALDGRPRFFP